VDITFVLIGTNLEEMANDIVVQIPGSIGRGAKVSWAGSDQPLPYPEELDPLTNNLWVSNYANDATGINCGVDGIGSN